jgi:hypothetical protein
MRKRVCDQKTVFALIWNEADEDGLWTGDAAKLGEDFAVSEDEANDVLSELCDGGRVENLYPGTYAIVNWPERQELNEEESASRGGGHSVSLLSLRACCLPP